MLGPAHSAPTTGRYYGCQLHVGWALSVFCFVCLGVSIKGMITPEGTLSDTVMNGMAIFQ